MHLSMAWFGRKPPIPNCALGGNPLHSERQPKPTPHQPASHSSQGPAPATMTEAAQPTARRATVIFIFITVVIDVVALGVIIPVLPQLVVDFEGGNAVKGAEMYA